MRARVAALALILASGGSLSAAQLSVDERQRLAAHLEMTSSWLISEVEGLSPAQLAFRRAPGTWNILEVLDHLIVSGDIYWDDLQKGIKTPVGDRILSSRDADILWYGVDRTYRETAIPPERPRGDVRDLAVALDRFRKQHARLLAYVKTTKDDLRQGYVQRQRSDAYQWALLISTHVQRHILQIREVKASPQFPKPTPERGHFTLGARPLRFSPQSLNSQNLTADRELAGVGWNWLPLAGRGDRFGVPQASLEASLSRPREFGFTTGMIPAR
jgi:hypothetical protein